MSRDITDFHNHELQYLLALFLTKPDLYKDHRTERDKQGYLFRRFRVFASDYYHLETDPDAAIYFSSMRKEMAGEANVCGGAGNISHSCAKWFKDRYKQQESSRETTIDRFAKKYGLKLDNGDPRLFLGITEIWNKLDRATEIVATSKWSDALDRSYCDDTLTEPISAKVDKLLIPLAIRNRVIQKHLNASRRKFDNIFRRKTIPVDFEEEEGEMETAITLPPPPLEPIRPIVIPPEMLEDW